MTAPKDPNHAEPLTMAGEPGGLPHADLTIAVLQEFRGEVAPVWIPELKRHLSQNEPGLLVHWLAVAPANLHQPCRTFDTFIGLGRRPSAGLALNLLLSNLRTAFTLLVCGHWRLAGLPSDAFISACIGVLQEEGRFAQVKLHTEDHLRLDDRSFYAQQQMRSGGRAFQVQSPRKLLGGLTLKPAITCTSVLRQSGPFSEDSDLELEDLDAALSQHSSNGEDRLTLRSPSLSPFAPPTGSYGGPADIVVEGSESC